jgi:hypothetical protein
MSAKRGSESPGQQPELPKGRHSLRILIADDERDTVLTLVVGFDHYLLKPCSPNQLIALLAPLRAPPAGDRTSPSC